MSTNIAIRNAVNAAGGVGALAARLGVTERAARKWMSKGLPADRVLPVYRALCGAVTPHDLRPDIYPDPTWLPPLDEPPATQPEGARDVA